MQVSLAPTRSARPSVCMSLFFFGFPYCQRLWGLTKRRDDIKVADMVARMVADMEVDMVVDMVVDEDEVADMVADMEGDKVANMVADI